jgi:hypothetical protein
MTNVTVLIPTYEHDGTLEISAASALAQTERDLEVLIVGDGATAAVRAAGERLVSLDSRVKFLLFPKGERHGEANRHEALKNATGSVVCYLSDDDLWLPDHLETILSIIPENGLAHTYPTAVLSNGASVPFKGSAEDILDGRNHVPFSAMGHTMGAYRALPIGWSPTPREVYTDLHMWRKFLLAGFSMKSSPIPTVVHFPSPHRTSWSQDKRKNELSRWARLVSVTPETVRKALLDGVPIPALDF